MVPKDKDHKLQKSGIIYNYKCPHTNCPQQYIGESVRTLGDRVKEHLRAPSPIHQYSSTTGDPISPECFTIVHRETQGVTRYIKEAMFIRINDSSYNRNIGKYQLPHIWDQILQPYNSIKVLHITSSTTPSDTSSPHPTNHVGGNNIYFFW